MMAVEKETSAESLYKTCMDNLYLQVGQIMFSNPGRGPGALIIDLQNMYAYATWTFILLYTFIKLLIFLFVYQYMVYLI